MEDRGKHHGFLVRSRRSPSTKENPGSTSSESETYVASSNIVIPVDLLPGKRLAAAAKAQKSLATCETKPDTANKPQGRYIINTHTSQSACALVSPASDSVSASCSNLTQALIMQLPNLQDRHPRSPPLSRSQKGCSSTTLAACDSIPAFPNTPPRALWPIKRERQSYSTETSPPLLAGVRISNASKVDIIGALGICGDFLEIVCGMIDFDRTSRPVSNIPETLNPTPLQLTTPHYRWIDRLPFPRLRDNLILLTNTVEVQALFMDILTTETFTIDGEHPPWDPRSWRPSPAFRDKWGYLFH